MIDLAQWRASVGSFHNCMSKITKISFHSNIFTHMSFALRFHFLLILFLLPPCMILSSIYKQTLGKLTYFQWLLVMHAILIYNISHRINTLSGDIHPNPGPNFSSHNNNKNFTICHLNIRSITANKKLNDLIGFATALHDFDIITLSETWLGPVIPDGQINIPGYDLYRKDRNRNGGGVCMYIKNIIPHKHVTIYDSPVHESVWVEVYLGKFKHLIGTFYRPPGQLVAESDAFLDAFQTCIDLAHSKHYTSINILGDFNDRCVTWDSPENNAMI